MNNKLQNQLLKDFKIISNFFEVNGLKLKATYGTLLGAVRNGAIIPWDDDIDLCITEEELPLFLKIAKKLEIKYGYKVTYTSIGAYNFTLNNRDIYIDVFVYFKSKTTLSLKTKISIYLVIAKRKRWSDIKSLKFKKDIFMGFIVKIFASLFPTTKDFKRGIHDKLKDNNSEFHAFVSNPRWWYESMTHNSNFKNVQKIKFEDDYIWTYSNFEEILIQMYGSKWHTPIKWKDHNNK